MPSSASTSGRSILSLTHCCGVGKRGVGLGIAGSPIRSGMMNTFPASRHFRLLLSTEHTRCTLKKNVEASRGGQIA